MSDMPDSTEALNFIATCALSRGESAQALALLERAVQIEPGQPELWKSLGIAQLNLSRPCAAAENFNQCLQLDSNHFVARLYRGIAYERLHNLEKALPSYYGAIVAAQSHGEWLSEASTANSLRNAVRHAFRFVAEGRRKLFSALIDPLRRQYGSREFVRIENALAIYLGDVQARYPDSRQRPKFFYVPGLRTQPYYEAELFPWQAELEGQTETILAELQNVLADPANLKPFLGDQNCRGLGECVTGDKREPQWNAFFFHRHGNLFEENARRCPRTAQIIGRIPLVRIREHAPEALFSILTAGTHILPHRGVTNIRLVTHLPLIVPGNCALRVGNIEHVWQVGRCVTFDDTYEHEAWNRSEAVRVVLILDSWHPDLTDPEKHAIAVLVGGIGDFNRSAQVTSISGS